LHVGPSCDYYQKHLLAGMAGKSARYKTHAALLQK